MQAFGCWVAWPEGTLAYLGAEPYCDKWTPTELNRRVSASQGRTRNRTGPRWLGGSSPSHLTHLGVEVITSPGVA